jgi:hypothetical protein
MLIAVLCIVDREAHHAANLDGKSTQVLSGRSDPMGRAFVPSFIYSIVILL